MSNPFAQLDLDQLRRRQSMKWRAYPPDVLPLWVAEMDTLPPEPVRTAIQEALAIGDTGYPWGTGYAEAYAAFATDSWGWQPDPAGMSLVADVMNGIVEALRLVTSRGDTVVLVPPVYPPFFSFLRSMGRDLLDAPLGADHRLDLGAVERAFATATQDHSRAAALLCNPHNPTGTVHTAAELTAVAELADHYGVSVVSDEIHAPLVYASEQPLPGDAERFTPYLSLPAASRGFAVFSASKGWNLAGIKAALIVAGPDARADLERLPEEVGHGPSSLGVLAHTVALREGREWLAEHLTALDENRRQLGDLLAAALPEIGYTPPAATYLAWLDCRPLGLSDRPAEAFLDRGRVALSAGEEFGAGGRGHVRLNFATSPAVLAEAVQRMAAAVR